MCVYEMIIFLIVFAIILREYYYIIILHLLCIYDVRLVNKRNF